MCFCDNWLRRIGGKGEKRGGEGKEQKKKEIADAHPCCPGMPEQERGKGRGDAVKEKGGGERLESVYVRPFKGKGKEERKGTKSREGQGGREKEDQIPSCTRSLHL